MLNNRGFPGRSAGKESFYNAEDPGSSPESGKSPGEGIGYSLLYSWTSLVAQLVKNLPAMRETWVQFLSWEDPLEKGRATHSSILAWRIPWNPVPGVTESDMTKRLSLSLNNRRKQQKFSSGKLGTSRENSAQRWAQ